MTGARQTFYGPGKVTNCLSRRTCLRARLKSAHLYLKLMKILVGAAEGGLAGARAGSPWGPNKEAS